MNNFWTHQDNIPEGYGFGQFSLTHFALIFLSVLLIVLIIKRYKRMGSDDRLLMRRQIAVILLVLELAKIIIMSVTDARVSYNLPLEICSFGGYTVMLDAFLEDKKIFSRMLLYLFLPAATMSIFFPTTSILPVLNAFTIHQFLFHVLIVAYALMRYAAGEIEPDYPSVWKSIMAISLIALCVYIIDYVFKRNFMFLMGTYDNFMLDKIWNLTGGGVMYDLGLTVFSMIVIHIFYCLFAMLSKLPKSALNKE